MPKSPLWDNPEFIEDCRSTLSKAEIMEKWGVSSGLVVDVRKEVGAPIDQARAKDIDPEQRTTESSSDGSKSVEFIRSRPITLEDAREWIRSSGDDPENYVLSVRSIAYGQGLSSNRMSAVPKRPVGAEAGPAWPVVQRATPVIFAVPEIPSKPARNGLKLSLKCADPQIGFRALSDGTYEEFHDWGAMEVFVEVCRREQPESIIILGDFLDLPSQSRWAQEAGFGRTTQMALDAGYLFLGMLRNAAPDAEIVLVEGNHDKRMQNFIETNALSAFGIRKAGLPDDWPVMSLQNLLRLDELRVTYMDAYPAATHWDNDTTRNIHGTRANSKGSTTSQYSQELPHISTWVGHTHRAEITYKTVLGPRGEAIESYTANPGCLAKTDGTVPSVHGALHVDGSSAKVVEDWQAGFGANLFDDHGNDWPQVYRIKNGRALYNGELIAA